MRQLGTVIHPGTNVKLGRDYTLYATVDGVVKYERLGSDRKKVSVYPRRAAERLIRRAGPGRSAQVRGAPERARASLLRGDAGPLHASREAPA